MSDTNPIAQVKDVTKVYRQGSVDVNALRGLDLELARGEFTAICGPSGSGKTTALNLIGALDAREGRWRLSTAGSSASSDATGSGSSSRLTTSCPCSPPTRTRRS